MYDSIKFLNPSELCASPTKKEKSGKAIRIAPTSFSFFSVNSIKKSLAAKAATYFDDSKKIAESEKEGAVGEAVRTANRYYNYDSAVGDLKESLSELGKINVKIAVFDFLATRLEVIGTSKQAKLNKKFIERVKGKFRAIKGLGSTVTDLKGTVSEVKDSNSKMYSGVFDAINNQRLDDVQNIVSGNVSTAPETVPEKKDVSAEYDNLFKSIPDFLKSKEPSPADDPKYQSVLDTFNGFANHTLDVDADGKVVPVPEAQPNLFESKAPTPVPNASLNTGLNTELEGLKKENSTLSGKIDTLRQTNTKLMDNNSHLASQLSAATSRISALEGNIAKEKADNAALSSKNEKLEQMEKDMYKRIKELEADNSKQVAMINQYKSVIEQYERIRNMLASTPGINQDSSVGLAQNQGGISM